MAITGKLSDDRWVAFNDNTHNRPYDLGRHCREGAYERYASEKKDTYSSYTWHNCSDHRVFNESLYSHYKKDLYKQLYDRKRRVVPDCDGILILADRCNE